MSPAILSLLKKVASAIQGLCASKRLAASSGLRRQLTGRKEFTGANRLS